MKEPAVNKGIGQLAALRAVAGRTFTLACSEQYEAVLKRVRPTTDKAIRFMIVTGKREREGNEDRRGRVGAWVSLREPGPLRGVAAARTIGHETIPSRSRSTAPRLRPRPRRAEWTRPPGAQPRHSPSFQRARITRSSRVRGGRVTSPQKGRSPGVTGAPSTPLARTGSRCLPRAGHRPPSVGISARPPEDRRASGARGGASR